MRAAPKFSKKVYEIFTEKEIANYLSLISLRSDEREQRISINYINVLIENWSDPDVQELKDFIENFLYVNSTYNTGQYKVLGIDRSNQDHLDRAYESLNSSTSEDVLLTSHGDDSGMESVLSDDVKICSFDSKICEESTKSLTKAQKKRLKKKKAQSSRLEGLDARLCEQEKASFIGGLNDIDFGDSEDVIQLKASYIDLILTYFNITSSSAVKLNPKFTMIPFAVRIQIIEKLTDSKLLNLEPKAIGALLFGLVPEILIKEKQKLTEVMSSSFVNYTKSVDQYLIYQLNLLISKNIVTSKNCLEWLYHFQLYVSEIDKFQIFTSSLFQNNKVSLANCNCWLKGSREINKGDREKFKVQIFRHAYVLGFITPANAHLWVKKLEFDERKFVFEFIRNLSEMGSFKFSTLSEYYDAFTKRLDVTESIIADIFIFAIRGESLPPVHRKWKNNPDRDEVLFIIMMFELQKYADKQLEQSIRKIILDFEGNKYPKQFIVSSVVQKGLTNKNFVRDIDKSISLIDVAQEICDFLSNFSTDISQITTLESSINELDKRGYIKPDLIKIVERFIEENKSFINAFMAFNCSTPSYDISGNIAFLKLLLENKSYSNDLAIGEFVKFIFEIHRIYDYKSICEALNLDSDLELKKLFIFNFIQQGILLNEITVDNFSYYFDIAIENLSTFDQVSSLYDRIIISLINTNGISVADLKEWYHLLVTKFSKVRFSRDSPGAMDASDLFNHIDSFEAFYETVMDNLLSKHNYTIYEDAKPALRLLMLDSDFIFSDAKYYLDRLFKASFYESFLFESEETDHLLELDKFLKSKSANDLSRIVEGLNQISKAEFLSLIEKNLHYNFADKKAKKPAAKKKSKSTNTKFDFFDLWHRSLFLIQIQQYLSISDGLSRDDINQLFLKQAFIKGFVTLFEPNLEKLYLRLDFSKREIFNMISKNLLEDPSLTFLSFSQCQDKIMEGLSLEHDSVANANALYQEQQIAFFKTVKDYDDVSFAKRISLFANVKDFIDDVLAQNKMLKILFILPDNDLPESFTQIDVKRISEFFEGFLTKNPNITLNELKTHDFHVLNRIISVKDKSCLIS